MTKRVELAERLREMAGSSMFDMEAVCSLLEEAAEALAADRAEAGELPELPGPRAFLHNMAHNPLFSAKQMHEYASAYGQQCARAASCEAGELPGDLFASLREVAYRDDAVAVTVRNADLRAILAIAEDARAASCGGGEVVDCEECQVHREAHLRIDTIVMSAGGFEINHEGGYTEAWENTIEAVARLTTPPTPSAGVEVPVGRWMVFNIGCIECGVSSDVVGIYPDEETADRVASECNKALSWREGGQNHFQVFDLLAKRSDEYAALTAALEGDRA